MAAALKPMAEIAGGADWPADASVLPRAVFPASMLARQLAGLAHGALVDEAMLSPKPGLVDGRGSGAHSDLSLALMLRSADALRPAFETMALAGQAAGGISYGLRERLGALGRDAEAAMLAATGGVNTHRGAIWCLGLLVGAAAWQLRTRGHAHAGAVAATAGAVAVLHDRHRPRVTGNKGELACLAYGVGGARAQARAGFPHVLRRALPALVRSRARGDSETSARLNALLSVMAELDDTCVLARAGRPGLQYMQAGACAVLAAGGAGTVPGRRLLRRLDAGMLARRASPGGAADLLAAALFLDRVGSLEGGWPRLPAPPGPSAASGRGEGEAATAFAFHTPLSHSRESGRG